MEDFLRACHSAVLDSGAQQLSAKMGVAHMSLLQRANPDNDAHHLTAEHVYGIVLHTGDLGPVKALADAFDLDVVPRARPKPKAILSALANLAAESGDVSRLIVDALEDNHISQHERAQGDKAIQEAIDALLVLRESWKAA